MEQRGCWCDVLLCKSLSPRAAFPKLVELGLMSCHQPGTMGTRHAWQAAGLSLGCWGTAEEHPALAFVTLLHGLCDTCTEGWAGNPCTPL